MDYWLLKTEPNTFSIQDLSKSPRQTTEWEGVRNYQARNLLRDKIMKSDRVLIYHSNADPPAVVGTGVITRGGYPDHYAWDKSSKYYDEKSDPENPRWFMVDVKLDQIFQEPIGLPKLREMKALAKMELLRKGSRLSVQPVRQSEFDAILRGAQSP